MSLRQSVRRGVTQAVHTDVSFAVCSGDHRVYGPSAAAGGIRTAGCCAGTLVQCGRSGAHATTAWEHPASPQDSHLCCRWGAQRRIAGAAQSSVEGSNSLGLEVGPDVVRWSAAMQLQRKLGKSIVGREIPSICSWWRRTHLDGVFRIWCHHNGGLSWTCLVRGMSLAVPREKTHWEVGEPGNKATHAGWIQRSQCLSGMWHYVAPGARAQRTLALWFDRLLEDEDTMLGGTLVCCAGFLPEECARDASCRSVLGAEPLGRNKSAAMMQISRSATSTRCRPCKEGRLVETFCGCWSAGSVAIGQQHNHPWLVLVMLSSLLGAWGGTGPVSCMEHPRPSSSSGSASAGRMDAANALQVTAEAHVARWRSQHGMQSDADFGFAFSIYEEAVAAGGHHLAAAWVSVRSEQLDQLLPEAAELMESTAANVPSRARPGVPRVPVKEMGYEQEAWVAPPSQSTRDSSSHSPKGGSVGHPDDEVRGLTNQQEECLPD